MKILIPMAGEGSRFKTQGFALPKPLIPVDGIPMVIRAVNDLPPSTSHIFICRDAHITEHQIDVKIRDQFPEAEIIGVDYLTEGQASTCLLAKDLINNDEELMIGACDNGMIYDKPRLDEFQRECDVLAFTFRNNVTVLEKPNQYGWLITDSENNVTGTSIKKKISDNPMKDHAVVGAFWFKKGRYFVEAAEKMIRENRRVNNEFYVDECMHDCKELGLKVKVFEIRSYLCWGTPNDYHTYNYWKEYFTKLKL